MVTGDIDIHVDDMSDTDAVKFLDLLESMEMMQHVNTPTHRAGHMLDLMITREFDCMIHSDPSSDIFSSDHCYGSSRVIITQACFDSQRSELSENEGYRS